jgi:hypothetical protein
MKLTYTPVPREATGPAKLGGLPNDLGERVFSFKPNKLLSVEAEAIEDATDWTFEEFGRKFMSGSMKAKRAALWILLRREFAGLKFRDLSFTPEEVAVDFDDEETAALRQALADDPDLDDEERAEILAVLGEPDDDEDAAPKGATTTEPATAP